MLEDDVIFRVFCCDVVLMASNLDARVERNASKVDGIIERKK